MYEFGDTRPYWLQAGQSVICELVFAVVAAQKPHNRPWNVHVPPNVLRRTSGPISYVHRLPELIEIEQSQPIVV